MSNTWERAYPESGIDWSNNNAPYLDEANLGIMDEALKTHDKRLLDLYGYRTTMVDLVNKAEEYGEEAREYVETQTRENKEYVDEKVRENKSYVDKKVEEASNAIENAQGAIDNANTTAENAKKSVDGWLASADVKMSRMQEQTNTAINNANAAANNANEAAQAIFNENYILTARTEFTKSTSVSPTSKGNAILEKLRGDGWQRTLSGKNLVYETFSGYNISDTGLFAAHADYDMHLASVKEGETYAITTEDSVLICGFFTSKPLTSSQTYDAGRFFSTGNTVTIPSGCSYIAFRSKAGYATPQIEPGSVATEFEPYCGATPSPNPSYEQKIHSVGDMGWFDGEWLQGAYSYADGVYTSSNIYVCNKNFIPCKNGDVIKLKFENSHELIRLLMYKEDGYYTYIDSAYTNEVVCEVTSDYTNFNFNVKNSNGITPSTVGHVCVTINGKYALIVDETNANLFDINKRADGYSLKEDGNVFSSSAWYVSNYIKVVSNTSYYLLKGSTGKDICFYDSDNKYITKISCAGGVFVVPNNKNIKYLRFNGIFEETNEIMLAQSYVEISYTPHQSTRHYIPLDEPLRGIGDVKDEVVPQEGVYGEYRNATELIVDGTQEMLLNEILENVVRWQINWTNVQSYVGSNAKSFCDKLQFKASWTSDDEHYYQNGTHIFVYLSKDKGTSLEEIKEYFAENPYTFVGLLKEPTFTPFEDQTPFYELMAYDEVTHVSIAGCHEELNPSAVIRFPRNEDGALETTNHCEKELLKIENAAIRAEMEEIKAALLVLGQA